MTRVEALGSDPTACSFARHGEERGSPGGDSGVLSSMDQDDRSGFRGRIRLVLRNALRAAANFTWVKEILTLRSRFSNAATAILEAP